MHSGVARRSTMKYPLRRTGKCIGKAKVPPTEKGGKIVENSVKCDFLYKISKFWPARAKPPDILLICEIFAYFIHVLKSDFWTKKAGFDLKFKINREIDWK